MAEFTTLDRDLPWKVMTQGLEIFFKYTGQPITCYRCGSTEHVVKNCLKQRSRFGHIRAEDRVLAAPPNPTSQATQDSQMDTTGGEDSPDETSDDTPPAENSADISPLTRSFSSVIASMPDLSPTSAARDLFDSQQSQQSRKCPPPRPPENQTNQRRKPEAKKRQSLARLCIFRKRVSAGISNVKTLYFWGEFTFEFSNGI